MSKIVGYGSSWYVAADNGDYYPDNQPCYDTRAAAQVAKDEQDREDAARESSRADWERRLSDEQEAMEATMARQSRVY